MSRYLTAGESHGTELTGIIEGIPAGFEIRKDEIDKILNRRQLKTGAGGRMNVEKDEVSITSGIVKNLTTGGPIAITIKNRDWENWKEKEIEPYLVPRPGHADFTYFKKYGIRDYRGGGRQSARETAARVAAGAIAKKVLENKIGKKYKVIGAVTQLGILGCNPKKWNDKFINKNPFFCPDKSILKLWEKYLLSVRKAGSSCGAIIELRARGIPVGLGAPIYSK